MALFLSFKTFCIFCLREARWKGEKDIQSMRVIHHCSSSLIWSVSADVSPFHFLRKRDEMKEMRKINSRWKAPVNMRTPWLQHPSHLHFWSMHWIMKTVHKDNVNTNTKRDCVTNTEQHRNIRHRVSTMMVWAEDET